MSTTKTDSLDLDRSKYEFKDEDVSIYKTPKGLSLEIVDEISSQKNEPLFMKEYREKSYRSLSSIINRLSDRI